MKFEIKKRFTSDVIEVEIDASFENSSHSIKLGAAVKVALKSGTYLRGADLRGANLRDAYLRGANLRDAYLRGADLRDAYLRDADLRGAYLRGADLRGANLRDAYLRGTYLRDAYLRGTNLRGANLQGADLQGAGRLIGKRPILIIGNIGSDNSYLQAYLTDNGIFIKRGCFFGSLKEFAKAVKDSHQGTVHFDEYKNVISFVKKHFKIWGKE